MLWNHLPRARMRRRISARVSRVGRPLEPLPLGWPLLPGTTRRRVSDVDRSLNCVAMGRGLRRMRRDGIGRWLLDARGLSAGRGFGVELAVAVRAGIAVTVA